MVPMMPFANPELGVRGIIPAGWSEMTSNQFARSFIRDGSPADQTTLIIARVPGLTIDEVRGQAISEFSFEILPQSVDVFKSPCLNWDLYAYEVEQPGVGEIVVNMGIAKANSTAYVILLGALKGDYEAQAPMLETIFSHTMYALTPLE